MPLEPRVPKTLLRRAAEHPQVQVVFHALGGMGLGLLLVPFLPQEHRIIIAVLLLTAAIGGHWYAVLTDPNRRN